MKRHPFDPLSFIFGIAFVAIAGAFALHVINIDIANVRWLAAGLLLFTGAVMLVTSRTGSRTDEHNDTTPQLR